MEFTVQELLVANLSHQMKDGEVGFTGMATGTAAAVYISAIPYAAMELAKRTHAPNLTVLLSGWCINPDVTRLDYLPELEFDTAMFDLPCEAQQVTWPGQWSHRRGDISFGFGSGIQIDRHGNINSTCIGPVERPTVEVVGPIFLPEHLGLFGREYYVLPRHVKRNLVEQVDHITGVGFPGGREGRAKLGLPGNGPEKLYTPLCVFAFDQAGLMVVESIHPGVEKQAVIDNTGFDVGDLAGVKETPPPTAEELDIIRTVIDPRGILLNTDID